jgi:hypothetical protein
LLDHGELELPLESIPETPQLLLLLFMDANETVDVRKGPEEFGVLARDSSEWAPEGLQVLVRGLQLLHAERIVPNVVAREEGEHHQLRLIPQTFVPKIEILLGRSVSAHSEIDDFDAAVRERLLEQVGQRFLQSDLIRLHERIADDDDAIYAGIWSVRVWAIAETHVADLNERAAIGFRPIRDAAWFQCPAANRVRNPERPFADEPRNRARSIALAVGNWPFDPSEYLTSR